MNWDKEQKKDLSSAHNFYAEALTGLEKVFTKNHDDTISYKIGMMYLNGKGTDIDLEYAEKYLLLSADSNNYKAQYMLGKLYQSDNKKDLQKAEKVLIKGAENAQDKQDCVNIVLASCIFHKRDMTRRHHTWNVQQQKIITMQHTLSENSIRSNSMTMLLQKSTLCTLLSIRMMLWEQQRTALVNCIFHFRKKEKHCSISIKAADKDNVYGMYAAGKILLDSRKSTESFKKEYATFQSAADKDFEPAIYTLGKYYSSFNNTKAKEYLKRSAFEYNDPNAQYILGKVYLSEK